MDERICFVSPASYGYFNPDVGFTGGGAERQIYLLSTQLAENQDIHVIVSDHGQPKTEVRDGVTLHRAYRRKPRDSPLQLVSHFFRLGSAMRRADADVYVFRGKPRNAPFVYLLSRVLRAKWVYNIANDANLGDRRRALPLPLREFHDFALEHADLVVLQTEKQKRLVETSFDANAVVIPNGYPIPDSIPEASEREYFLWVGTMDDVQKRPHLFLDIAESIPDEEFRLVGPCDEANDYEQGVLDRAEELDNVKHIGEVPPDDVHEYYRRAIALLNTSAFEGFPNTYLEAWRYDTPVLGLEVDPGRFVEPNIDAFAEGDMKRFKEMIARLSGDKSMQRSLGSVPGEYVRSELSLEVVANRYVSTMMDIL